MRPSVEVILLGIVVGIIVFLILREVFCWYWKINRINASLSQLIEQNEQTQTSLALLRSINNALEKLIRLNEQDASLRIRMKTPEATPGAVYVVPHESATSEKMP